MTARAALNPHQCPKRSGSSGDVWWYEDEGGIWVYGDAGTVGSLSGSTRVTGGRITWKQLEAAMKRSRRSNK